MTIFSERLQLRPATDTDIDDVWRIFGDPETHRFNPRGPLTSRESAEQLLQQWLVGWRQDGFGEFAISLKSCPQSILGYGGITHRQFEGRTFYNLGFSFTPDAWGNGYASEFAQRMLWFGFTALQLKRISATVREPHLASRRVLEKSGMQCVTQYQDIPDAALSLLYEITLQTWRQAPVEAELCSVRR